MNFGKIKENIAFLIFIFFILILIFITLHRIPFYDEAHAFVLSRLDLKDIFYLTRFEGHPALWYLLLKITSSNINLYPYSMLFTSLIFSCALSIFFYFKSPFDTPFKLLFLFSYPFLFCWAILARPYHITILAIFLLTYFYKNSLKNPVLYSLLLLLCFNTTIMGMIGAAGFLVLFVYDLFKKRLPKKDLTIMISILILELLLLVIQFLNFSLPQNRNMSFEIINPFFNFYLHPYSRSIFIISFLAVFVLSIFIFYKKSKKALCYLLITNFSLIFLFLVFYRASFWHHCFFIIYLISAYWISFDETKNVKSLNVVFYLFLILCLNPFSFYSQRYKNAISTGHYFPMIAKIEKYKDAKLFCFDFYSGASKGILPYLIKDKIKIYDFFNNDIETKDAFVVYSKQNVFEFNIDKFVKHLDKERENYLFSENSFFMSETDLYYAFRGEKYALYFIPVDKLKDYNFKIYKIEAIKL